MYQKAYVVNYKEKEEICRIYFFREFCWVFSQLKTTTTKKSSARNKGPEDVIHIRVSTPYLSATTKSSLSTADGSIIPA